MFCHKCGAINQEGDLFCHLCGIEQVNGQEESDSVVEIAPDPESQPKEIIMVVIPKKWQL